MLNVVALLMILILYRDLFLEGFLKGKKSSQIMKSIISHYFAAK